MLNQTEIMNLAIGNLGVGKSIAIPTENSSEARACTRWWKIALEQTLRTWHWPFARTFEELGLVAEQPTIEWAFSYRYPSDCVDFQRIVTGLYRDNSSTLVPYIIGSDAQGKLIYANHREAVGQYTRFMENTQFWPGDFTMTFAARLAMLIAPQLTSRESGQQAAMAQLFQLYLSDAKANAYNEQQDLPPPEAESIRAREGEHGYGPYRFED